jgi:hypothetical protein
MLGKTIGGAMSVKRDFGSAIHRALHAECKMDVLGAYSPKPLTGVRLAWGRLANLLAILKTGETFTAVNLARAAKVCKKTVHRDIDYLRRQGVKIIFNFSSKTFQLDRSQSVPTLFGINKPESQ